MKGVKKTSKPIAVYCTAKTKREWLALKDYAYVHRMTLQEVFAELVSEACVRRGIEVKHPGRRRRG
ncbi:MAG: hypothetical protein ACR2P5_02295 [Gammaproteobacteria bacterium]